MQLLESLRELPRFSHGGLEIIQSHFLEFSLKNINITRGEALNKCDVFYEFGIESKIHSPEELSGTKIQIHLNSSDSSDDHEFIGHGRVNNDSLKVNIDVPRSFFEKTFLNMLSIFGGNFSIDIEIRAKNSSIPGASSMSKNEEFEVESVYFLDEN